MVSTETAVTNGAAGDNESIRVIDLFAGAGGLTLGFVMAYAGRIVPVWANDFDPSAVDTYNANFEGRCTLGDILDILADPSFRIPSADIVVGGPPCQGFSLLNRNRESDPRKHLWQPFLQVVERSDAAVFVMENVPQLLGSPEYRHIIQAARALGFRMVSATLLAADYGVPQLRRRAFIVGSRDFDPQECFPPSPTHMNPTSIGQTPLSGTLTNNVGDIPPWRTVRDAIGDLPTPAGTDIDSFPSPLDLHFGRRPTETSLARYRAIPHEGMNRLDLQRRAPELTPLCWIRKTSGGTDLFGRLWWDRPAFTIRTEFFKPEKGRYLHPQQHRPITHREAARLQSFPDSFEFKGSKIEIARQIGNAVPPLLAARVASAVEPLLSRTKAKKSA